MDASDFLKGAVDGVTPEKSAAFERAVVKHILRRGNFDRTTISKADHGRGVELLDEAWANRGQIARFPYCLVPILVESFSLEDIFTRPQRSEIIMAYRAAVEDHGAADPHGRPVAMPFKTYGLGKLIAVDVVVDVPALIVPGRIACSIISFDVWMDKVLYRRE